MKYILLVITLCLPLFLLGQTEKVVADERLHEVFETTYLDGLVKENPFLIQRWNYYLDHAYYITEDPKMEKHDYPTVKIEDLKNFNILKI